MGEVNKIFGAVTCRHGKMGGSAKFDRHIICEWTLTVMIFFLEGGSVSLTLYLLIYDLLLGQGETYFVCMLFRTKIF